MNDRIDSLTLLLSNLRKSLATKGITNEPVIEKFDVGNYSNKHLATAILDDLVQMGE
jgi:hypothetical protein